MLSIVCNGMHDSATTVFMRCTVAVINGYNLGLKMVYKRTPMPLRTPDQNITLKVPPWPKQTYHIDRATILLMR